MSIKGVVLVYPCAAGGELTVKNTGIGSLVLLYRDGFPHLELGQMIDRLSSEPSEPLASVLFIPGLKLEALAKADSRVAVNEISRNETLLTGPRPTLIEFFGQREAEETMLCERKHWERIQGQLSRYSRHEVALSVLGTEVTWLALHEEGSVQIYFPKMRLSEAHALAGELLAHVEN